MLAPIAWPATTQATSPQRFKFPLLLATAVFGQIVCSGTIGATKWARKLKHKYSGDNIYTGYGRECYQGMGKGQVERVDKIAFDNRYI